MSNVIPLPKRPGRHAAHRADVYSHPAYRYHRTYMVGQHFMASRVDNYVPTHHRDR